MKLLLLALLSLSFITCVEEEEPFDTFLIDHYNLFKHCEQVQEMDFYRGEDVTCRSHYYLTEFEGQKYIKWGHGCVHTSSHYVYDVNCVSLCKPGVNLQNSDCRRYLEEHEVLGVLFIGD